MHQQRHCSKSERNRTWLDVGAHERQNARLNRRDGLARQERGLQTRAPSSPWHTQAAHASQQELQRQRTGERVQHGQTLSHTANVRNYRPRLRIGAPALVELHVELLRTHRRALEAEAAWHLRTHLRSAHWQCEREELKRECATEDMCHFWKSSSPEGSYCKTDKQIPRTHSR